MVGLWAWGRESREGAMSDRVLFILLLFPFFPARCNLLFAFYKGELYADIEEEIEDRGTSTM